MRQITADQPTYASKDSFFGEDRKAQLSCLAVLAVAMIFFLFNTAQGIGIFTDSTRYMGISARDYDAPLYHWALTFGRELGLQFTQTATIIAVLTLSANIILIHSLLARATGGWLLPTVGAGLVALSPQFVTLHSSAMSEPPFLTFLLLTMWAALNYFQTGKRRSLIICSAFLGLATLTRFAAPPLGAAIAVIILATPGLDRRQKFRDVAWLTAVGGVIFLAWVAYSQMTAGRSIGRELWFYGNMGLGEWVSSLEVMTAWILPDQIPLMVRIPILVTIIGTALAHAIGSLRIHTEAGSIPSSHPAAVLSAMLGMFFIFYMIFIVLAVSIEANLTLTGRYAFPAYVALAMLATLAIFNFQLNAPGNRCGFAVIIGLALMICGLHGVRSVARTPEVYRDGYGYQHVSWRTSPAIAAVKPLPHEAVLYSNGPDIISFHTGRTAEFSPHEYMLRTGKPEQGNPIALQFQTLRSLADEYPTYVVMFDHVTWRHYLAGEEKLVTELGLQKMYQSRDGRIYRIPPRRSGATRKDVRNGGQ